jgi:glucosylceramidase
MKNLWKLSLILLLNACHSSEHATPTLYVTTADRQNLLKLVTPEPATESDSLFSLSWDADTVYQEMEGFGASLTGASAHVLYQLPAEKRAAALRDLFDPITGIGLSYLRLTIGASDFSTRAFTYNDLPQGEQDPNQTRFNLADDRNELIPVLKEILTIDPELPIMASPWSAPAWMKTSGKLEGGQLKPEWYASYALYFLKYIQHMQAEGIRIDAITIQNEPQYEASYPTMGMTADQQNVFIRDHLGPLFEREKIKTKIVVYDHNWDTPEYPISILNDPVTRRFVHGAAFHCYGGDVANMDRVRKAHPDKKLYFTECSGGMWAPNFGDNLMWYTDKLLIGTTHYGSANVLLWNLALNERHGPTTNQADSTRQENLGCMTCRGVITVNTQSHSVTPNEEYFALAHFAKFVKRGARRIRCTMDDPLQAVAFLNPDQSVVVVVQNPTASEKSISWGTEKIKLLPRSVNTIAHK